MDLQLNTTDCSITSLKEMSSIYILQASTFVYYAKILSVLILMEA